MVRSLQFQRGLSSPIGCGKLVKRPVKWTRGFTLLELLCVLGISAILGAATLPAINGMLSGPGRLTAVNQLVGALEQARLTALDTGVNSYVGFANDSKEANIPAADQYREYIIFRAKTEDDAPSAPNFIQVTKWQPLPKGISFKSAEGILASQQMNPDNTPVTYSGSPLPSGSQGVPSFPVVEFTPTGAVLSPTTDLYLYVYQGFYNNGNDQLTSAQQPFLDRLTLAHYTGRVQADVVPAPGS
jgi:prepilin-type N-terminal cleavage/methylation domain-containing protein